MMDAIKGAVEGLSKWKKGDSNKFWALTFLLKIAQVEFAVPYRRATNVTKLLAPLVKQTSKESLNASATVSYLVGGDEEGEIFDPSKDSKHSTDRIIDLLENTLNLKAGSGYGYGK